MKQSAFEKLRIGDIVETKKGKKAKVIDFPNNFPYLNNIIQLQYLDTKKRVWKRAKQLQIKVEGRE